MKSIAGKATAEFLRKAAAALRGKAAALRARLLLLASLRRRAAVVAGISRQIRALSPGQQQHRGHEKAAGVVLSRPAADRATNVNERAATQPAGKRDDVVVAVGMAELASLFRDVDEEEDGDHQDWTLALRSMFDDYDDEQQGINNRGYAYLGDDDLLADGVAQGLEDEDDDGEETSVIELIRSRREGEGREFKIHDEIDQATDMFITRVRRRMGAQQPEPGLGVSGFHQL